MDMVKNPYLTGYPDNAPLFSRLGSLTPAQAHLVWLKSLNHCIIWQWFLHTWRIELTEAQTVQEMQIMQPTLTMATYSGVIERQYAWLVADHMKGAIYRPDERKLG